MIDEKKITELEKQIEMPLYSETLPKKQKSKTDITKLNKLAKEIRKTIEDYSVEAITQPHTGTRP